MNRFFIIGVLWLLSLLPFWSEASFASLTYTPATQVYMTGSSIDARFDVAKVLFDSGSSLSWAYLDTQTRYFSGVFYLWGIGWVELTSVQLDCGGQSLANLSTACTLHGTAQSEMIGEVTFDPNRIQYIPATASLSGMISSFFAGDFSLSGVRLPLRPAQFSGPSSTGVVDHQKAFFIDQPDFYQSTLSPFQVHFSPIGTFEISSSQVSFGPIMADLSLASAYIVTVIDPSGSKTEWTYTTTGGTPSMVHTSAAPLFIQTFCSTQVGDSRCPDWASLESSYFAKSGNNLVADGVQRYDFTLKLRDQYGNRVTDGTVRADYIGTVKKNQTALGENWYYTLSLIGDALDGDLNNYLNGTLTTGDVPVAGSDVTYTISSLAPTNTDNTIYLSGLIYTSSLGVSQDFSTAADRVPLTFRPWVMTTVSAGSEDIVIGQGHTFSITTTDNGSSLPSNLEKTIGLWIGTDNLMAAYTPLESPSTICTKAPLETGMNQCAWSVFWGSYSPASVIVTEADTFSGTYTPSTADPILEAVSYNSYVSYTVAGETVIYPSGSGSLGTAKYDTSLIKILGQNNVGKQFDGVNIKNDAPYWNTLREKIAKLSRNRTTYTDVDYEVVSTDQTIDASYFTSGSPKKRTLIVIGGDITIDADIPKWDHPLALIALAKEGIWGDIHIDPSVKNIAVSLFAEHAVHSSGDNQLSLLGSVISHNTMGETISKICPYFVTADCSETEAKKYDLEQIRIGYRDLTDTSGHTATLGYAASYGDVPLIIEYDGRILGDPPPGF